MEEKKTPEYDKLFFIFALSTEIFCMMIAKAYMTSLAVHFFGGLTLIYFFFIVKILEKYKKLSQLLKIIGLIFGSILSCFLAGYFYETWRYSTKIISILRQIPYDPNFVLKMICYFSSLLTIPFTSITVSSLMKMTITIKKGISFKQVCFLLGQRINWKVFGLYIGIILISSVLGTILLMGAYSLPSENIIKNIQKSAYIWRFESNIVYSWCSSQLDVWADAIMALEASDVQEKTLIDRAMMAYRGKIGEKYPHEVLPIHFIDGKDYTDTTDYPRYWHGYHVLIKPLFEIADYHQIRILNGCVQFILFLISCLLFVKRKLTAYIIPWSIGYLMMMPIVLAKSFQYSSCFYIYMIGSVIILLLDEKQIKKGTNIFFLLFGVAAAYFDFLTFPTLTCSIPMLIYLLRQCSDSFERQLSDISGYGISWCAGYIGMWGMKWLIATIFTECNVFADAAHAIKERTSIQSYDGLHNSPLDSVLMNVTTFFQTPFAFLLIILVIYTLIMIEKKKAFYISDNDDMIRVLFIFVGSIPIVWYIATINHSTIHYWFTNKACLPIVLALGFSCIRLIQTIKTKEDVYKNKEILSTQMK